MLTIGERTCQFCVPKIVLLGENGYVIIHDAAPAELIQNAAQAVWRFLEMDADNPAVQTCAYLDENVCMNRFVHVTVANKGLGNSMEQRHLHYSEAALAEGTASLKYAKGRAASESVTLDTIDNLIRERPVTDFIKIDVEGYQLEVLRAGGSTA